ncbi:glycosyltransferase family 2 protein [Halorhodospira neutriphila]|uniref:Glycosyltransferase 2-like domain-containing protein n=1 Tax=Halorhodospira neutriphila TaxID=168379 RepID=A0ABS1E155_9GAMM|nr:glycosyltransferase family 2 protein [Halorhodospira neutriphila]MBK1725463.1 hypothetical protein [Halorhodospira neutriphila]
MSNKKQVQEEAHPADDHLLTLAIPTYNRAEIVTKNLKDIISKELNHYARILIIDNHSEDGTYEKLLEVADGQKNIEILRQNKNVQLFGNVLSLFEFCNSQYILINSDEDQFEKQGVLWALDYIKNNDVSFVSGAVRFYGHKLYRSGDKKITANNIRPSSNYGSGLLYNAQHAKKIIPFIKDNEDNEIVWLYPMFGFALAVYLYDQNCFKTNVVLSNKQYQVETQIQDTHGGKYYHLESRISQLRSLRPLAENLTNYFGSKRSSLIESWIEYEFSKTFSKIRAALLKEDDYKLLISFDQGAKKYYYKYPFKKVLSKGWSIMPDYIKNRIRTTRT